MVNVLNGLWTRWGGGRMTPALSNLSGQIRSFFQSIILSFIINVRTSALVWVVLLRLYAQESDKSSLILLKSVFKPNRLVWIPRVWSADGGYQSNKKANLTKWILEERCRYATCGFGTPRKDMTTARSRKDWTYKAPVHPHRIVLDYPMLPFEVAGYPKPI